MAASDPTSTITTPAGPHAAARFFAAALTEPLIHGWDLSVSVGIAYAFDDDAVDIVLDHALALGGQLVATGMYGPPVDERPDDRSADRLLAALGRNPTWTHTL